MHSDTYSLKIEEAKPGRRFPPKRRSGNLKGIMKLLIAILVLSVSVQAGPRPHGQLAKLTHGLTFTTSLEKSVYSFVYQGTQARGFMRRVKALDNNWCQPSRTFDEETEWLLDPQGSEGIHGNLSRLASILTYMRTNLTDLQTAFFGEEPGYEVYVFGRDKAGRIVGIRMVEVT